MDGAPRKSKKTRFELLKTNLGRNIQDRRKELGLTQAALATAINKPQHYVSRLERGKENPTLRTIATIERQLSLRAGMILLERTLPGD